VIDNQTELISNVTLARNNDKISTMLITKRAAIGLKDKTHHNIKQAPTSFYLDEKEMINVNVVTVVMFPGN